MSSAEHKPSAECAEPQAGPPLWVAVAVICGVALVMLLPGIAKLPLFDPDESRCAVLSRGMLAHDDWLVPRLEGKPYFDKPPLFFWLSASAEAAGVPGPAAGRLVSVLAALLTSLLVFDLARRWWDRTAALVAGVVANTSVGVMIVGRLNRMDMLLVLCMTFSLWSFFRMECAGAKDDRSARRRKWMLFYLGAALGTLTKGPVALVLPGAVVVVHLLVARRPRELVGALMPAGLATYLVVSAPWFVHMTVRFPAYFHAFFIVQHLGRFGTSRLGHAAPVWFYLPVLVVGFLPWSCWLGLSAADSFPRGLRDYRRRPELSALWTWTAVVIVFFSLSHAKVVQYILPAWPAVSLLTAHAFVTRWRERAWRSWTVRCGAMAAGVLPLVLAAVVRYVPMVTPMPPLSVPVLLVLGVVTSAAVATTLARASVRTLCLVVCVLMVGVASGFWQSAASAIYEFHSTRPLGLIVREHAAPDDLLASWDQQDPSFAYYAGREQATKLDAATADAARAFLTARARVWYLVPDDGLDELQRLSPQPLYVIARHANDLLVSNRPLQPPAQKDTAPPPRTAPPRAENR